MIGIRVQLAQEPHRAPGSEGGLPDDLLKQRSIEVLNLLDGNRLVCAHIEISQYCWIELIDDWEAVTVVPKKFDQIRLAKDSNYMVCALFDNEDTMHAASKTLDCFGQVFGFG